MRLRSKIKKILKGLSYLCFFIILFFCSYVTTPSLLQVFSVFLFVMTAGAILDAKNSRGAKIAKFIIYALYFIYSIYTLGLFYNLSDLISILDIRALDQEKIFKVMFGFVAPLCMLFVIKKISNASIKEHHLFNFFTVWIIYLVVAIIWKLFYPEEVLLEFMVSFWFFSLLIMGYYKFFKGGGNER